MGDEALTGWKIRDEICRSYVSGHYETNREIRYELAFVTRHFTTQKRVFNGLIGGKSQVVGHT